MRLKLKLRLKVKVKRRRLEVSLLIKTLGKGEGILSPLSNLNRIIPNFFIELQVLAESCIKKLLSLY